MKRTQLFFKKRVSDSNLPPLRRFEASGTCGEEVWGVGDPMSARPILGRWGPDSIRSCSDFPIHILPHCPQQTSAPSKRHSGGLWEAGDVSCANCSPSASTVIRKGVIVLISRPFLGGLSSARSESCPGPSARAALAGRWGAPHLSSETPCDSAACSVQTHVDFCKCTGEGQLSMSCKNLHELALPPVLWGPWSPALDHLLLGPPPSHLGLCALP